MADAILQMAGGRRVNVVVRVCRRRLFCKNSRAASRDTVDSQNYTYVYEQINYVRPY